MSAETLTRPTSAEMALHKARLVLEDRKGHLPDLHLHDPLIASITAELVPLLGKDCWTFIANMMAAENTFQRNK